MDVDLIDMLERIATYGTPPEDGCSLYGVGYEDAFKRIRKKYLEERFDRGKSAEKFVVGPFGSGKTHFIRQLMELARTMNCVTAEVALSKKVDFTQSQIVYAEVAREINVPGLARRGIRPLIEGCIGEVRSRSPINQFGDPAEDWLTEFNSFAFELESFGSVARAAVQALLRDDQVTFDSACRWLGGEFGNRALSKTLDVPEVSSKDIGLISHRALQSLLQLVRYAGYRGTVICFDEAEQGLTVDKRKMEKILSILRSGIDDMADLKGGSAMLVYAVTPDLVQAMENYEALRQRVTDPNGWAFFEGNTLAPKIDLTRRQDPTGELYAIGERLVNLFYEFEAETAVPRDEVLSLVMVHAHEVAESEASVSNRREMAKRVASTLWRLYETGTLDGRPVTVPQEEDEV